MSSKSKANEPQKENRMDEPLDMSRLGKGRKGPWEGEIHPEPKKGEKDPKGITVPVEIIDGDYCIILPDKFVKALNWEEGDTVEWTETELCYDWGETTGYVLRNLTKEIG
jgi:hypothetical protein